jgi:hypothetical protein
MARPPAARASTWLAWKGPSASMAEQVAAEQRAVLAQQASRWVTSERPRALQKPARRAESPLRRRQT